MNDYQRSLEGFNEPSIVDDQIEQAVEDSAPVEGPQDGALHVEHDSEGELQPVYESPETQPVQQQQQPEPEADPNEDRLNSLDEFLENSAVEIRDWIDNKLQGDQQSKEEIRAGRQEARQETARQGQETAKRIDEATDFGTVLARDGVRAVTSGVDKAIQDSIGAANFVGDLAKTKLGMVEEDDEWNNVDHANYRGSERDLVMSEPRSAAGLFARDMVGFITVANKAKLVTGLGAAGTAASQMGGVGGASARIAVETAAGAVADFLMDPGDGNAANMLQELFPSLQDNEILSAFAHEDDDDEFTRRVLNMVEGGVMGNAVDAAGKAMKGLLKGGGVLKNWMLKNPGKKAVDAPAEVKAEAVEMILYHGTSKAGAQGIRESGFKTSRHQVMAGEGVYFAEDPRYAASYAYDDGLSYANADGSVIGGLDNLPEISGEVLSGSLPQGSKILDIPSTGISTMGFAKKRKMRSTKELVKFAKDNGYDGIRYDPDFSAKPGEGGAYEIYIFDPKLADQVVAPKQPISDRYKISDTKMTKITQKLSSGDTVNWYYQPEEMLGGHTTVYDISWDMAAKDGKIGTSGKQMVSEFRRHLKGLKPGTVISAQPVDVRASDATSRSGKNIRGNIYSRMGFGKVDDYHGTQFGIVRADGKVEPIDLTLKLENREAEQILVENTIARVKSADFEGARPGAEARYGEASDNGGTKSRQDYEPYERASITTETPMGKVVDEQAFDASRPMYSPGAPSPRLTDNTVRQIAEAGGDVEVLEGAVKELEETFTPLLKANDPVLVKEAKERLAKLIADNTGEQIDMSALEEVVGSGADAAAYVQSLLGNTVAKVYLKDLSSQLSTLGKQARQIADTGMDANKQYNLMLDRLKAAATIQIKDASRRGGALKTLQRNLTGGSDVAVKKKVDDFTTKVEDLRTRINEGDVSAVEEMRTLTDSMVLADGNADIAESFWTKWASMTKEDFEITMFNSYLSGINTQQRNILGNSANIILKPAQMMMGASGEQASKLRKSSLAMYSGMWSDLQEGFQVARTALADSTPDSISKREAGNAMGQNMAEKIANLRASAKGPAQNAAANLKAAQYYLLANPWLQGATRLLDASDRGFRTLSARQKLRFDQNMLALDDGIKFDPKVYDKVWSTKFKNGEIADEQLLTWAKQDTFQEDLGENMSKVADMINTIPGAKYIIPFVKTPTNIIKQTAHYVPLVGKAVTFTNSTLGTKFFKEFDEVMNGSDEAMKAVYRGREATGYMISVLGVGLGSQGLITGQGPSDPQKRELWEAAGNQQHSINIGGQWVSTRFLGPLGILLSAYADLGTMAAQPGNYDNFDKLRNQLIYTTAGALTDQSFLKGLFTGMEGLMDAMSGNPKEQKPGKWQADLLRAITPYSAALRAFSNTLTPGMREYDTEYERYAAEIGLKGILDLGTEKISMRSGEPVVNAGYSALNQFIPFSLKEAREDPLLNKLVDLGVDMPMEMTQKYKGMKLSVEEQNKINAFVAKSGVWDRLEVELNSKSFEAEYNFWKNGPQGDDKRDWKPIPREKAKWYMKIKAALAEARNDGIEALRRESVDFDSKITAIEKRDFHGRRGNYYGASDAQLSIEALKTF